MLEFLLFKDWTIFHHLCHILFIYLPVYAHLNRFYLLATRVAAQQAKLDVQVFFSWYQLLWVYIKFLDHTVILFFIFGGISILFSIVATPFCIPINSVSRSPFLHILSSTCHFLFLFWFSWLLSNEYEVDPILFFNHKSNIYIFFSRFFFLLDCYKILNIVPCAMVVVLNMHIFLKAIIFHISYNQLFHSLVDTFP